MRYPDYLRLEGGGSIALGLVLAVGAFPGLFVSYRAPVAALALVPAVVAFLAVLGVRAGAPLGAPGRWLTERPLREAAPGRDPLPASPLRRRLLVETGLWIVLSVVLVAIGSSGWLLFGTGLASVAFGVVQAVFARRRVLAEERARGTTFLVARRPGLGTPSLTLGR